MILGTAGYMSPEQARGKPVDKRADIWAFGVVLFEMLTGKGLFEGETVSDTLAQVLTKEPDWEQVPAKVRRLLQACLQKDPKQRLQAIGDWRIALTGGQPQVVASSRSRLGWTAAALLAVVAAIAVAGWWRASRPADLPPRPLMRLDVDLGVDPPDVRGGGWVILSPDGSRVAYASKGRLYTRRLDQPDAKELPGTDVFYPPFFSPDGRWIAFEAQDQLQKIPVEGGEAIPLCGAHILDGGSWGEDGNIVANLVGFGGLSRISSTGGPATPFTELAPQEFAHLFPQILPGGKAVLFTRSVGGTGQNGAFRIEVVSLADRHRKVLVQRGTFGRYLAGSSRAGYLTYVDQGTLFAVPFDLEKLEVHGDPLPVLEGVATSANGFAWVDVSPNGTLVYRTGGAAGGANVIQWLDEAGHTQPLLAKPGAYFRPRFSPDGQRLAIEMGDGVNDDIWTYDWQRDTMSRLTFGFGAAPVWSPDGRYIAFSGPIGSGLFSTRADGVGKPQSLTHSENVQVPNSFTPDGKRLVFVEVSPQTGLDLWTLPIENDGTGLRAGKPEVFLGAPYREGQASVSPDGKWLAYYSDESGAMEVYVRAFPDNGGKWQISNGGGMYPAWSRNGRELFYRTVDNQIMVASYAAKGDSFAAQKPRVWSPKRIANIGQSMNYDVAPDGKRIAAIMPAEASGAQPGEGHVTFVLNFFDELRRLVPVNTK